MLRRGVNLGFLNGLGAYVSVSESGSEAASDRLMNVLLIAVGDVVSLLRAFIVLLGVVHFSGLVELVSMITSVVSVVSIAVVLVSFSELVLGLTVC